MMNKFEGQQQGNIYRNTMNVNSPVFVPQTLNLNHCIQGNEVNSLRRFNCYDTRQFTNQEYLYYFYNFYQQPPVNWVMTHVPEPIWRMMHFTEYDTMQRRGSKDCHQRDQSVSSSTSSSSSTVKLNESGNDINQSQNQQQTTNPTNNNKSTKGQNNRNQSGSGGGVNKRHHDNKGHSHPWLVTTLKGHTSEIRDMDFSSNGKYLASCAEDNIIRRSSNPGHRNSNSTSSDLAASDDINSSSSNEDISATYHPIKTNKKPTKNGRSRRQRKNHHRTSSAHHHHQHYSMDIDDECKENQQPPSSLSSSSSSTSSSSSSSTSSSATKKPSSSTVIVNDSVRRKTSEKSSSSSTSTSSPLSPTLPLTSVNTAKRSSKTLDNLAKISKAVTPPLRQHTKLNLKEPELIKFLRCYIIDPNLLRIYGYPVESAVCNGSIEIFKCLPRPFINKQYGCYYGTRTNTIINKNDGLNSSKRTWEDNNVDTMQISGDSGQGSESSSPPSVDSDTSETEETTSTVYYMDGSYQIYCQYNQSLEKKCVRCKRSFYVTDAGEYLTKEECVYHWGKINSIYMGDQGMCNQYSCCNGNQQSEGCTRNRLHVWTGVSVGINGPYQDFVRTEYHHHHHNEMQQLSPQQQQWSNYLHDDDADSGSFNNDEEYYDDVREYNEIDEKHNKNKNNNDGGGGGGRGEYSGKVYALDCEMCFTGLGLELAKITIIESNGNLVYEHYVKPKCEIVDYNTRFSGITEKDLMGKNVKTFDEVQKDLLKLISADTILIGHALDNDLCVLKLIHKNIIDTSITFPHVSGFPYRRALKTLTKIYLNRDIQTCENGHSSFEDSRACLELMLWRIRKDFRLALEQ